MYSWPYLSLKAGLKYRFVENCTIFANLLIDLLPRNTADTCCERSAEEFVNRGKGNFSDLKTRLQSGISLLFDQV